MFSLECSGGTLRVFEEGRAVYLAAADGCATDTVFSCASVCGDETRWCVRMDEFSGVLLLSGWTAT